MTALSWTYLFTNTTLTQDQFIINLRTRIDEDSEDLVTDTQIKARLASVYNELANKTGLIPELMEITYNGEEYFDIPVDCSAINSIYMIMGTGIDPKFVPKTSMGGASNFGYIRKGFRLYVYGILPGATLKIFASRTPSLPTASNGYIIDLPDDFLECLYYNYEFFYWKRRRASDEITNSYNLYKEALQDARDNILDNYGESVSLYGKNT